MLPSYQRSLKVALPENNFFFFGYNFFDKFKNDKIFTEDSQYVIGIDGVILNLQNLKNSYGISNYFSLIKTLFQKNNIHFASQLKGEFNGFIFDKKKSTLFFFNNKTATKQVFYTSCNKFHIISCSIANIISFKEKLKITSSLNENAVYSMLTFGAMLEKQTLVNDVFKLLAGKYLVVKEAKIAEKEYFSFNNTAYTISSKNEAMSRC